MNNWYSKGIKTIGAILDDNCIFYTFDRLKEIYRVRGTFLNYENILQKIPNQWENIKNENRVFIYQKRYNITCNVFVAYLLKDKKGSRRFYDILAHVGEMGVTNSIWKYKQLPPEFFCQTSFWQNDLVLLVDIES